MTALVTIVVVLAMELLFWKSTNSVLFYVLFYALYPGNAVSLMITGGHGTTGAKDSLAALLGILINVVAYVIVVTIARGTIAGASRDSK
jgi:hypothetical protein